MPRKRSIFAPMPTPLIRFLVAKVGMKKAIYVAGFIVAWGKATEVRGSAPNFREFSEFWGHSEAETYRQLAAFKEVWPNDRTPARVWEWLSGQVPSDDREVAVAEALSVERDWEQ